MTKKEQIMQALYNGLESIMVNNKFILFRNKEIEIELPESEKLVNIIDGSADVIDTVLSPRIDTVQLEIPIELYIQKEEFKNIDIELDEFETIIKESIKNNENLKYLTKSLILSYSETSILEPENGLSFKLSNFNLVVVFDDI